MCEMLSFMVDSWYEMRENKKEGRNQEPKLWKIQMSDLLMRLKILFVCNFNRKQGIQRFILYIVYMSNRQWHVLCVWIIEQTQKQLNNNYTFPMKFQINFKCHYPFWVHILKILNISFASFNPFMTRSKVNFDGRRTTYWESTG